MFIVVGSRSDPSAIACEETGRHVIVTVVPTWVVRDDRGRPWVGVLAGPSRGARLAPPSEEHRMCDVTDDCGARVGADHSRRLTVYRITLAVSLLLQLYCAPVRAGRLLSPVCAHDRSGRKTWMQSSNEHNECLITAIM